MKGNGIPPVDFTEINNKITQTNTNISQINTTISNYWSTIYPVNSIYMSVNSTSPATLFGGTWVQLKDRFLLGAGSTYSNGTTGGTTAYQLRANIGAVNDNATSLGYIGSGTTALMQGGSKAMYSIAGSQISNFDHWNHATIVSEQNQNSTTTTIIPPYLVVYIWKRTA